MKMMLPEVIGNENQSQHYQHHRCVCLDLSGRIITPDKFSYHTGTYFCTEKTLLSTLTFWPLGGIVFSLVLIDDVINLHVILYVIIFAFCQL